MSWLFSVSNSSSRIHKPFICYCLLNDCTQLVRETTGKQFCAKVQLIKEDSNSGLANYYLSLIHSAISPINFSETLTGIWYCCVYAFSVCGLNK